MQIAKVDPKSPQPETMERAARILHLGGLVVYPTETVYGLGANIIDAGAIQKVIEAKGRAPNKPISIAFRDVAHASRFAEFNPAALRLAEFFLPGPLTMILPAKVDLGEAFGGDKIAVRISSSPVLQAILSKVKFPVTATSANTSGKAEPISARDSIEQIGDKVDLVLDAGTCEHSKPSTLVEVTDENVVILREGAVPKARIRSFLESMR